MNNSGFIDINGNPWKPSFAAVNKQPKPTRTGPDEFHKGWRVVGLPPGAKQVAFNEWERYKKGKEETSRAFDAFDESAWLLKQKREPVRSKPYEIKEAADQCAALAEKAGWICVQIEEIKRTKQQ